MDEQNPLAMTLQQRLVGRLKAHFQRQILAFECCTRGASWPNEAARQAALAEHMARNASMAMSEILVQLGEQAD